MKRIVFHIIIPLAIVAAAVFGFRKMMGMIKPPERVALDEQAPKVSLLQVAPKPMTMQIAATGSVVPARQITLTPEVTGRIVKLSAKLAPGARFKKGDIIARLDQRDYKLFITQEQGRVRQAELELQLEASRAEIAEHELELLGRDKRQSTSVSALARRAPQLDVAKRNTASAKSGLDRAKLNLNRTVLRAPFNAVVLDKRVDLGQLVGPSTPIATLMGSDALWINLSVPVEKLPYIQIPGVNAKTGSAVEITHRIGANRSISRAGHVIRLQGQLDSQNRTATILVQIDDPFDPEKSELPLLAGAYVTAKIQCEEQIMGVELPPEALHDGRYVWTLTADNRIEKQAVQVGWKTREEVVVLGALEAGTRVVTSPLSQPIDGMLVSPLDPNGTVRSSVNVSNPARSSDGGR